MGLKLTVDPRRITPEGKALAEALSTKFRLNLERAIYAIAERELLERMAAYQEATASMEAQDDNDQV